MAAATMYVTPAGAGDKSGSSWANAMGLTEWEADVEGSAEAGDVYYVKPPTYTLTNAFATTRSGTYPAPIRVIGVKVGTTNEPPVVSDWATEGDHPLIAAGANALTFEDNWVARNLWITTTADRGFEFDAKCIMINCHSNNSSGTADRWAIYYGGSGRCFNCEAQSASGNGIRNYSNGLAVMCYIHDCGADGIYVYAASVIFCIIDTCTTYGIEAIYMVGCMNNTVYNCGVGIFGNGGAGTTGIFINNIIVSCTTGASLPAVNVGALFDYNNWYGNTADVSNVTKGPNATAYDPKFTDAPGSDFSLESDSECIGAGFPMALGVG